MAIFPDHTFAWEDPAELLPLPLATVQVALRFVGIREEETNWSPEISEMLASSGIRQPAPWCAAFVNHSAELAADLKGVTSPLEEVELQAYVPSYMQWAEENDLFVPYEEVAPGDIFCLLIPSLGRYGHMGLVEDVVPPRGYLTVEGNTNEAGSREGTMVRSRLRMDTAHTKFIRWHGAL